MRIVKLLLPILILTLTSCFMMQSSHKPHPPIYKSTSLIKYYDDDLILDDLIDKTSIIMQTDDPKVSEEYLSYLDSLITMKFLDSEVKNIFHNQNDDIVIQDYSSLNANQLADHYDLNTQYLILLTPLAAYNYYVNKEYSYVSTGIGPSYSTRKVLDEPRISMNKNYADSLSSESYSGTRVETNLKIIDLHNNQVKVDLNIINNEFYGSVPNIRQLINIMPDIIIANISFLKLVPSSRNLFIKLRMHRYLEINELVELAKHLDLKVIEKKYDYIISDGKNRTKIDKRKGLKNADYFTLRDISNIVLKSIYAPDFYDEGYEIPEDKKRPILLKIKRDKPAPQPVLPPK